MPDIRRPVDNGQVPVDIIDLTQESPLRLSRSILSANSSYDNQITTRTRRDVRPIPLSSDLIVINLDETIQETPKTLKRNRESNKIAYDVPCVADSPTKEPRILTCPICFEILTSNLRPMSTLCGHLYCFQCLQMLLTSTKKCAICQNPIKEKKCIRIHI